MPIVIGKKKPPPRDGIHPEDSPELVQRKYDGWRLAEQLGNTKLDWYQAEFVQQSIEVGKEHFLTHYYNDFGDIACPAGDTDGPCLHRFGAGLWHPVGTGKTFSALWHEKKVREFLRERNDKRGEWPSLFVTTTSTKWQWASDQIPKWRPELTTVGKVLVVDGDNTTREAMIEMISALPPEIVLIHHAQLSIQEVFVKLQGIKFLGIYVDEDQYFKNWSSGRTKRKNALRRGYLVSISATPESGFNNKLHAILHGIDPGEYTEYVEPPCRPGKLCPLPEYTKSAFTGESGCRGCHHWNPDDNICEEGGHEPSSKLGLKFQYQPGYFGTAKEFEGQFCKKEGGRVVDSKNNAMLNSQIYQNKFAHRITRRDVYGIQEIPITKIPLEMTPEQRKLYSIVAAGYRKYINESLNEDIRQGSTMRLAQLTHFRRITTLSPAAFELSQGGHPPSWAALDKYKFVGESCKIEWALEFIRDNVRDDTGNKIIIGSEWTTCLEDLRGKLIKSGMKEASIDISSGDSKLQFEAAMQKDDGEYFAMISGSVEKKHRSAIQRVFNTDPRLKVLLMTQAGYEGLNLTGGLQQGQTMYVTCLGVPWLPALLEQLFGRADRKDMKGDISILLPVCIGTIDEMVHGLLYGKALSSQQVIDGDFSDEGIASKLSLNDITSILDMIGNI